MRAGHLQLPEMASVEELTSLLVREYLAARERKQGPFSRTPDGSTSGPIH